MGKLALLAVALGATVLLTRQHVDQGASRQASQSVATGDTYTVLARSNALAGFARIEQALAGSFVDVSLTGAFEGGTYTAEADVVGTRARITAVGTYPRPGARDVTFRVRAVVAQAGNGPPEDLPPFLTYGVLANGDIHMTGASQVVQPGIADPTYSPLVHTNENLDIKGAARVRGFGSYSGKASGANGSAFSPPFNPEGRPSVQQAEKVEFPPFDADEIADAYAVVVDHYPSSGGTVVFGKETILGGTRANPVVHRIHGDLAMTNTHVEGYAVFVVDGKVSVRGSVTSSATTAVLHESSFALYAKKDITLSGNTSIRAQMFTEDALKYSGTVDIYGSLATGKSLDLRGTATIHTTPASPALAWAWANAKVGVRVLAYAEH
jgi:hypothetical protein